MKASEGLSAMLNCESMDEEKGLIARNIVLLIKVFNKYNPGAAFLLLINIYFRHLRFFDYTFFDQFLLWTTS